MVVLASTVVLAMVVVVMTDITETVAVTKVAVLNGRDLTSIVTAKSCGRLDLIKLADIETPRKK